MAGHIPRRSGTKLADLGTVERTPWAMDAAIDGTTFSWSLTDAAEGSAPGSVYGTTPIAKTPASPAASFSIFNPCTSDEAGE
jgi:hypothetical protein